MVIKRESFFLMVSMQVSLVNPGKDTMGIEILSASEFYSRLDQFMHRVDERWVDEGWHVQVQHERDLLRQALGDGANRRVLDCSCGSGAQAVPLAQLGWQVTATDVVDVSLQEAAAYANEAGVKIDFRTCDMRHLGNLFNNEFDTVISCMALDNILDDVDIDAAIKGMWQALKDGGYCYIRQRDFDHIMQVQPCYELKEERKLARGQVLRLEDWMYEGEKHVVCTWLFLYQEETGRWEKEVLSWRRRALRKAELAEFLRGAGFKDVTFLPQVSPWRPFEVIAYKRQF